MKGADVRWGPRVSLALAALFLLGNPACGAQVPKAPSVAGPGEPDEEMARLAKQVDELRQAEKLDEAVVVSGRILDLARRTGGQSGEATADALSRLADLHELRGDWAAALAGRREARRVRERVYGKDHWRTADARLALATTEKVAGLGEARAEVSAALRAVQDAGRSANEGRLDEAERRASRAMETFRDLIGPETAPVARAWELIGRIRLGRGDPRGAKELIERAFLIRRKILPGDHLGIARTLDGLAAAQFELSEYGNALASFEEALAIRRKSLPPGDAEIARSLVNIGNVLNLMQNLKAAKARHEEALAIFRRALPPGHPDIAQCLDSLGLVQFELKEYASAKTNIEEGLRIRRKALPGYRNEIADSLNDLGVVESARHEYEAARACHEEALAIRRKALPRGNPDIALSLNNLGDVRRALREYAPAKASYEEALAIRRGALPRNHPDVAHSLHDLGTVQYELRELEAAKRSYEEALAIRRRVLPAIPAEIADSLNNLGIVQRELRDHQAARRSHEDALAIRRATLPKDHLDIAQSLNNLGNVEFELSEYAAAKANYERALEILRGALPAHHPDIARSLSNLGNVHGRLQHPETARASYERALAIRRESLPRHHPDIADSLTNLGNSQQDLGDYQAARSSHQEALAIYRKSLPQDHPRIAHSLSSLGAVQHELGDDSAARSSLEEALAIYRKTFPEDHPDIAICLDYLARASLASGAGSGKAVAHLVEANDLLQNDQVRLAVAQAEAEQLAGAATAKLCLDHLIGGTIVADIDPGTCYDRVVRGKGAVTARQRWARRARDVADPETARLLDRLREVTRQIVGQSVSGGNPAPLPDPRDAASLRDLVDARARLEQGLSERSAIYRTLRARACVDGTAVRDALPQGTALVDIVDYHAHIGRAEGPMGRALEWRSVAFVVRPERRRFVVVPLGPTRPIAALVDRWRASYGAGKTPPAGEPDPAAELRKRIWEPLARHFGGVKVVLISPDGPLNGLPWAALPGSKPETFLVHEYAFAVVPVPQLLPELMRDQPRRDQGTPSLLLAGGIDFGQGKERDPKATAGDLPPMPIFGPLPGAESEVNDLRAQFEDAFPEASPPRRLTKDRATKEAILAAIPSHRFVHLATHGFFADESQESAIDVTQRADLLRGGFRFRPEAARRHPGLLSGLVFAGINRPDRRLEQTVLTALEAGDLDLGRVELVVLSACQTGRGRVAGGEGVLGLQRAFQIAGASSVVASLWKVPDEETHQLMREFYRRVWTKDPISKAEALRQAQLWMLENWKRRGLDPLDAHPPQGPPPPYVWAAFVLSGDWR